MFFGRPAGHKYFDRGDPNGADFDETDLTVTDIWTDIDLSSIVPAGAVLVLLSVGIMSNNVIGTLQFRKKGNTYWVEGDACWVQVAGESIVNNIQVPCDINRKIQYYSNDAIWTWIDLTVKGWFR